MYLKSYGALPGQCSLHSGETLSLMNCVTCFSVERLSCWYKSYAWSEALRHFFMYILYAHWWMRQPSDADIILRAVIASNFTKHTHLQYEYDAIALQAVPMQIKWHLVSTAIMKSRLCGSSSSRGPPFHCATANSAFGAISHRHIAFTARYFQKLYSFSGISKHILSKAEALSRG